MKNFKRPQRYPSSNEFKLSVDINDKLPSPPVTGDTTAVDSANLVQEYPPITLPSQPELPADFHKSLMKQPSNLSSGGSGNHKKKTTASSAAKRKSQPEEDMSGNEWRCIECGVREHETPLKRRGPDGKRNLCNACYVRFRVRMERAERGSKRPVLPASGIVHPLRPGMISSVLESSKTNSNTNAAHILLNSGLHPNLIAAAAMKQQKMDPFSAAAAVMSPIDPYDPMGNGVPGMNNFGVQHYDPNTPTSPTAGIMPPPHSHAFRHNSTFQHQQHPQGDASQVAAMAAMAAMTPYWDANQFQSSANGNSQIMPSQADYDAGIIYTDSGLGDGYEFDNGNALLGYQGYIDYDNSNQLW